MLYDINNIVENSRNISGIFCLSSATSYYGWGTKIPVGLCLLSNAIHSNFHKGLIRYISTHDMTNNLVKLPTGNYITNKDRTILETMNYAPIDEFTSQEMEDYGIEENLEHLIEFNNKYHYCSQENFDLALQCYYEWIVDPH